MDERVRERYALGELGQEAMDILREYGQREEYDPYGDALVLALLAIVAELRRLPG